MIRRIFNSGILLLILVLILPACSKKKEPAPPAEIPQDAQKVELPSLAQNTAYLANHSELSSPKDLTFEEAPNPESASSIPVPAGD